MQKESSKKDKIFTKNTKNDEIVDIKTNKLYHYIHKRNTVKRNIDISKEHREVLDGVKEGQSDIAFILE